MNEKKNIVITGASGFIGSFLVEEALVREYNIYCLVRKTTNTSKLEKKGVTLIETDFSCLEKLKQSLTSLPKIDFVLHNAGLTRAVNESDFFTVNKQNTQNLINALKDCKNVPGKFLFVSSLAACGPSDSEEKIRIDKKPEPLTAYGKSKLAAEEYIIHEADIPYLIFRPTAVYGPGDKDFFQTVKLIEKGIDVEIGRKKQQFTFIYAPDFARLVFTVMESDFVNRTYMASDGAVYRKSDLGQIVAKQVGKKVKAVKVPVLLAKCVAAVSENVGKILGKASLLRVDKITEMAAYSWDCEVQAQYADIDFSPQYNLENGMKETIAWYRNAGWLK